MQSTETDQASLDALAEYALSSNLRNDPLVIDLCNALAAERDRADRAEARLAEVRKYTFSISNGSTVARRILQMSEATA